MQLVSHAVLLGLEVALVVLVGGLHDRHYLRHLEAVAFEARALDGIVGDEAHLADPLVAQYLGADAVVALVGLEAQLEVGVDGVEALLLQVVGAQLVDEAYAAALLAHVGYQALALVLYHLHGAVQLLAAVALAAAEDVARGAARMHAHQHGLALLPLALLQHHVRVAVVELGVGNELEVAPARGQEHLLLLADQRLVGYAVGDEVLDGHNLEAELLGHFLQLRHAGHGAVVVDDFDEGSGGIQAGEAGQVDGGLGVAGAHQHAAVAGAQGVDVAGTAQLRGFGGGVGQGADGAGAVVHAHARGAAVLEVVDGDGERRAQERRVVVHLHVQLQLVAALLGDGGAEHPAAVLEHEVDVLGGDLLRRHDEVALVLAVLVVDDDDEFALAEILDGLFYSVEFEFHSKKYPFWGRRRGRHSSGLRLAEGWRGAWRGRARRAAAPAPPPSTPSATAFPD